MQQCCNRCCYSPGSSLMVLCLHVPLAGNKDGEKKKKRSHFLSLSPLSPPPFPTSVLMPRGQGVCIEVHMCLAVFVCVILQWNTQPSALGWSTERQGARWGRVRRGEGGEGKLGCARGKARWTAEDERTGSGKNQVLVCF